MGLADQVQRTIAETQRLRRDLERAGAPLGPSSFTSERFVWRVAYRDGSTDSEENGEGFGRVLAHQVARIEILIPQFTQLQGGEVGIHHDVPKGASAVFTRRRVVALNAVFDGSQWAGWTLIGHRWPDNTGVYFYFHNQRDESFSSDDFNDIRAIR